MNLPFWRNVTLIGGAHVAVIVGLIRWSTESKTPIAQNVTWISGSAGNASAVSATKPASLSSPPAKPKPKDESEEAQPVLTSAKSDIQLPTPTATPTPTPRSTSTPKPTPNVKVPPKRTPPPKPKPTPKPSPKKLVVAKASPKPTPEKEDVDLAKRESEPATSPNESPKATNTLKTSSGGSGAHGGGATIQSQFGWYGSMLHDRFYSEWAQPTNVDASGAKAVLAKLRIEKDGRVSSFEIVRPSGNAAIDDSVRAAAKRVTQVDPLPAGLGGDHYDVKIKFELSSD